jgi:hypothetical protein
MLYRKRKSPTVENKYESYYNFYFARRVNPEDVEWGFNFVVENAKIADLEVDWPLLSKNIKNFQTLDYPLKVDDHPLLVDIAEILHDIMKVDPSLFGFCMFSLLPKEMLKMIIEAHAKNLGDLTCRAVNKEWRDIATNEELFPRLKNRDLACVSSSEWEFFKDLYGVYLARGELQIDYLDGNDKKLAHVIYKDGLLFERLDPNFNFVYPPEVQKLHFTNPGAIGKALKMSKMDYSFSVAYVENSDLGKQYRDNLLVKMMEVTSWKKFHKFRVWGEMVKNFEFRKLLCDLHRENVLQTE